MLKGPGLILSVLHLSVFQNWFDKGAFDIVKKYVQKISYNPKRLKKGSYIVGSRPVGRIHSLTRVVVGNVSKMGEIWKVLLLIKFF